MLIVIMSMRDYRMQLESPYFNSESKGIALFDLVGTFVIAWILEETLHVTRVLKITKTLYYSSLVMLGVIVHILIGQPTFLNNKIFSIDFNIYKVMFVISLIFLLQCIYTEKIR